MSRYKLSFPTRLFCQIPRTLGSCSRCHTIGLPQLCFADRRDADVGLSTTLRWPPGPPVQFREASIYLFSSGATNSHVQSSSPLSAMPSSQILVPLTLNLYGPGTLREFRCGRGHRERPSNQQNSNCQQKKPFHIVEQDFDSDGVKGPL
jgi:hypothetical protein